MKVTCPRCGRLEKMHLPSDDYGGFYCTKCDSCGGIYYYNRAGESRNQMHATDPQSDSIRKVDFNLWSWLRSAMSQGGDIQMDFTAGKYANYEAYSTRMDCAARERELQLLEHVELRRPSDAKEIAQIQDRRLAEYRDERGESCARQAIQDIDTLLHALAESQRDNRNQRLVAIQAQRTILSLELEIAGYYNAHAKSQRDNARLIQQQSEAHCAIAAAGVETTQRIQELEAEIDRLQSPPEERACARESSCVQRCRSYTRVIVSSGPNEAIVFASDLEELIAAYDCLLQDCARHRNAHAVNMARADAAEKRARELEFALRRIDSINDNPARFCSHIEAVLVGALASPLPAEKLCSNCDTALPGGCEGQFAAEKECEWIPTAALAQPQGEQPKVDCEKCGGAGWLRGSELDNPSEDTYADTMTKYSCDGDAHKPQAEQIDESKCLAIHAETGRQEHERCAQYPDCPCGGPQEQA